MRKSYLKLIAVISLLILIAGLTCCASSQKKEKSVTEIPKLYFPKVPAPQDGVVIPLDTDFKAVTTEDKDITFVLMPKWYWDLLLDYMVKTEAAVSALYSED